MKLKYKCEFILQTLKLRMFECKSLGFTLTLKYKIIHNSLGKQEVKVWFPQKLNIFKNNCLTALLGYLNVVLEYIDFLQQWFQCVVILSGRSSEKPLVFPFHCLWFDENEHCQKCFLNNISMKNTLQLTTRPLIHIVVKSS